MTISVANIMFHMYKYNKKQFFSLKMKKDLGMDGLSYSTFQETRGSVPLPSLSPIPFKDAEFRNEMGLRLCNGISLHFFAFSGGGI